jgi:cobalt-zinc-cadmium efflux system outer membrane protein
MTNGECGLRIADCGLPVAGWRSVLLVLSVLFAGGSHCFAAEPEAPPPVLTLDDAIRWALEHNPELAALRQQHGIAAAAVVIADTYPHNPVLEGKVRHADGPASAGITNRVSNEWKLLTDVEIRGQRGYRRAGAAAGLSRTEYEIAQQETVLGVRVLRAFNAVLYHQERLKLDQENIRLNEDAVEWTRKFFDAGKAKLADKITAINDLNEVKLHLKQARVANSRAEYDLRRALGLLHEDLTLVGTLGVPGPTADKPALVKNAMEWRADLHAKELAVTEADAKLKLAVADRWGNPNVGPAYEYDPTRINLIGVQVAMPLPAFNTHRGDIMQRESERARAALELRQTEIQVEQDVQAALARLKDAQEMVTYNRDTVIPELRKGLDELTRAFEGGDASIDPFRIADMRRRLLKARDTYLDALLEVNEARADLAAALGNPSVAGANPHEATPGGKP